MPTVVEIWEPYFSKRSYIIHHTVCRGWRTLSSTQKTDTHTDPSHSFIFPLFVSSRRSILKIKRAECLNKIETNFLLCFCATETKFVHFRHARRFEERERIHGNRTPSTLMIPSSFFTFAAVISIRLPCERRPLSHISLSLLLSVSVSLTRFLSFHPVGRYFAPFFLSL